MEKIYFSDLIKGNKGNLMFKKTFILLGASLVFTVAAPTSADAMKLWNSNKTDSSSSRASTAKVWTNAPKLNAVKVPTYNKFNNYIPRDGGREGRGFYEGANFNQTNGGILRKERSTITAKGGSSAKANGYVTSKYTSSNYTSGAGSSCGNGKKSHEDFMAAAHCNKAKETKKQLKAFEKTIEASEKKIASKYNQFASLASSASGLFSVDGLKSFLSGRVNSGKVDTGFVTIGLQPNVGGGDFTVGGGSSGGNSSYSSGGTGVQFDIHNKERFKIAR